MSTQEQEESSEATIAANSLILFDQKMLSFQRMIAGARESITEQVYILPVELREERAIGYFFLQGQILESRIGFVTQHERMPKYYHLTIHDNLREEKKEEGTLYLPLKLTDLLLSVGNPRRQKFIPAKGAPFSIYGIDGTREPHPVLVALKKDNLTSILGLYQNYKRTIGVYESNAQNKEISLFLEQRMTTPLRLLKPTGRYEKVFRKKETYSKITIEMEPIAIVKYLNLFVIGHELAKRRVSVPVSSYLQRVHKKEPIEKKQNIILIGDTGTGKTLIAEKIAEYANIPFIKTNITGKSGEGLVGENMSSFFEQLREKIRGEKEPYAIVILDEIDKVVDEDTEHKPVQNALIGWIESATVGGDKGKLAISTKNILFIGAGAFSKTRKGTELSSILQERDHEKVKIGFFQEQKNEHSTRSKLITKADLIAYGFKPELVGRFPVIAQLDNLTEKDLATILTNAEGSILKSFEKDFKDRGYFLDLEKDVSLVIAQYCEPHTGARDLGTVCELLFEDLLFEPEIYASNKIVKVSKEMAKGILEEKM